MEQPKKADIVVSIHSKETETLGDRDWLVANKSGFLSLGTNVDYTSQTSLQLEKKL